jgi:alpha-L-rhamnosidase
MAKQITNPVTSHPILAPLWLKQTTLSAIRPTDPDIHAAFRAKFQLPAPSEVEICLLGAHWYHAFLDAEFLSEGPARFHPDHPEYEIRRVHLPAGSHVLAIHAQCQGIATQTLLADVIPPFVIAAVRVDRKDVPLTWKAHHLDAWQRTTLRRSGLQNWFEDLDLAKLPRDWQSPEFDDSEWHTPEPVAPFWKSLQPLDLAPIRERDIAPPLIASGLLAGSFAAYRDDIPITFFTRELNPPREAASGRWWRFDLGRVRLGRANLRLHAPPGTRVEVGMSETIQHGRVFPWVPLSNSSSVWVDRFTTNAEQDALEPFVPRGGRFLEVHAEAPPDTLALIGFTFIDRGYFDDSPASLVSGDSQLDRIWHAGVETLRACAEDALVDTPVRERGQWTGDTLSVGLELVATLYEDSRLILRAMRQIAQCAREDGLVASLTPGANRIFFTSYACAWQESVWNYHLRTGYTAHLEELADAGRANLAYFENRFGDDGLDVGQELTFIDWGYLPPKGEPDFATHLFLRRALKNSIHWFEHINATADAQRARDFLQRLDNFLARELSTRSLQQLGYHTVALALGQGLLPGHLADGAISFLKQHILSCFPNDPTAPRLSSPTVNHPRLFTPYFSHFVFPVLIANGEMDFVLDQIRHCWGWALAGDRTTLLEVFDVHWSHCHHWSGCPTWLLSQHLLGLRPAFHLGPRHYEFRFAPGSHPAAQGSLPGGITIAWQRHARGIRWQCTANAPITIHDTSGRLPTSPSRSPTVPLLKSNHRHALFAFAALALSTPVAADPRDEVYWRTFYLTPIGAWGAEDPVPATPESAAYPLGIGNVQEYRSSMLALTGGEEPLNLRVGISNQIQFLAITQDNYYDWIYEPGQVGDLWMLRRESLRHDIPFGVHLNGFPWADSPIQSVDNLANHLETVDNGLYLTRNRNGLFRRGEQDPMRDEVYDSFAPALEMQTTLSGNATYLRTMIARNLRIASRILGWYREQHPDLIVYNSASSEYAQHQLDSEWFDYGDWTRQEFRDWLSGVGLYEGTSQFATLDQLNAEYMQGLAIINPRPPGFPFASWDAVQPPTDPDWSTTSNRGRWWRKWQNFRILQVANMVQFHQDQVIATGWSPDRIYGHQIPFNPTSTNNSVRRYATPWTTTFTHTSSNGITTYGDNAASNTIFGAIYSNDKNWGIFEYNPISTDVAVNRTAINNTWNNNIHVLTPYAWGGQETYRIQGGSALEVALREFLFDNRNNHYTGLQRWETHHESRDLVWSMSRATQVIGTNHVGNDAFDKGQYKGSITGIDPYLWLNMDATRPVETVDFGSLSFRMRIDQPIAGYGQFFWVDEDDQVHSLDFLPVQGWRVYQVNLANLPAWRDKRIKAFRIDFPGAAGSTFALDWVRLHALPAWTFSEAGELGATFNLQNVTVANGKLTATTTNNDGHFYLATDQPNPALDADRAVINADTHNRVRVHMTTSHAGTAELFFWRRGEEDFGTHAFPVQSGTHTYELDMSNVPDWRGRITRLRLDPVNVAGATFSVESIVPHQAILPPRSLFLETITNTSTPEFAWDAPTETPLVNVVYDLQVATDWDFEDLVLSVNGIEATQYFHQTSPLLDGLHYWRVRARSLDGPASAWSIPLPRFFRFWDFTRLGDAVALNHFTQPTINEGVWQATTNNGDPYLFFNTGGLNGSVIQAESYQSLRMRLRIDGPGATVPGVIYCFPRTGGFFVYLFNINSDNEWQDIEIDLAANPQWIGEINLIRLDPGVTAGLVVSMEHAELVPRNLPDPPPPMQAPEAVWIY